MRRFGISQTALRLAFGLAVAFGAAFLSVQAQTAQPGADLLKAARRGWEDYEKVARTWSFRVKIDTTHVEQGRQQSGVGEMLARGNGRCFSLERSDPFNWSRDEPKTKTWICKVDGPEYVFEARRAPGRTDWALTSLITHAQMRKAIANGDVRPGYKTVRDEVEARYLLIAVAFDDQLVSRLIDHACCRTERFAPVSPEPGALVEWRFTVDPVKQPSNMRQINSGRVLFDPNRRWVIKESQFDGPNGRNGITTTHRTLTYQPGPDGYPVPTEVRDDLVTDDRSATANTLYKFELVPQKAPPADKEFTLSAYGLPEEASTPGPGPFVPPNEPPGTQSTAEPSRTGWYLPLLGVGIALVMVALVLRFWQGRRSGSAAAD